MQVGAFVRWYYLGVGCGWHHGTIVELTEFTAKIKTPTGKLTSVPVQEIEVLAEPTLLRERPVTGAGQLRTDVGPEGRGSSPAPVFLRERPITGE